MSTCDLGEGGWHEQDLGSMLECQLLVDLRESEVVTAQKTKEGH